MALLREIGQWLSHAPWVPEGELLLLAALLGGLVGFQREYEGRPAGMRTHILVCVGACLMAMIRFSSGDPGRISAQVVTGVGFLGAGVILRRGMAIRGLTTAATVWVVAGIGLAVGAGGKNAALAAMATVIALVTLTVVKKLEEKVRSPLREASLNLAVPHGKGAVSQALNAITEAGALVIGFESDDSTLNPGTRTLMVRIRLGQNTTKEDVMTSLADALPNVPVEWEQ
ncbi:MAG: MgtC/SapB family protein [Armatimonas sp.]